MALKISIDKFENMKVGEDGLPNPSGVEKKLVGFAVVNETNALLIIDKYVELSDSKTSEDYTKEAYEMAKKEIDDWAFNITNEGKTFNPDTGKIE